MPTIAQSVMLASVLVGMVSIPAVSQELDISQPVVEDIDNISASEQNPETVEESIGPEEYRKSVETAFDEFSAVVEGDSSRITSTTPDSQVVVENKPGERTFSLETPSGEIVRTYSSGKVEEEVTAPEGTLVSIKDEGTVEINFEGRDRDSVEETASDLRNRLESGIQEIRDRYNATEESNQGSDGVQIEADIKPDDGEYIRLSSTTGVDLQGWNVSDEAGNTYTFGDRWLDSGESVTLYSGDGDDNATAVFWGQNRIWNNDGDTAYIYNTEGEKVLETSY